MALSIKSTPILRGEDARRFNREADINGKLPTPTVPEDKRRAVMAMWEYAKNVVFPPQAPQ